MFDSLTRVAKDSVLGPLLRLLPRWIHPDAVTLASLPAGLAAAGLAATGAWGWAVAWFVLNRALDGLDGLLARERGLQSDFGGYLDIMVDFLVYAAVPIGVWYGTGTAATTPLIVLLAVFYVNGASWMYLSAILEKRGRTAPGATSVTMPTGLVEGTETVVFFLLFLAIPAHAALLFWLMAGATAVGIIQRLLWAARHLRRST